MKKSLIAAAALLATSAFAQSSVTLFGVADIGYGAHKTSNLNGTVNLKSSGVMDGSHAGSRFGFRGTEDLGGGLTASFHLEQGINPTSADGYNKRVSTAAHQLDGIGTYSTGNNRQTFVGLNAKDLGTVRIGYQYTNSYDLVAFNGLNKSEFQGGNFQNGSTLASVTASTHANGTRANAITYMSNSMSGFAFKGQYGGGASRETFESNGTTGTNGTAKANAKFMSLMGQYSDGPIYAAAVYTKATQQTEAVVGQSVTNVFGAVGTAQTATVNTTSRSITGTNIGASYDLGMAKVSFVNSNLKGPRSTTLLDDSVKASQFTLAVPLGAAELFLSSGKIKRTTGTVVDADVSGTTLGARYNLSKRTIAYVFNGSEKNKAVTTSSATAVNYKDSKTVVGVAHSF